MRASFAVLVWAILLCVSLPGVANAQSVQGTVVDRARALSVEGRRGDALTLLEEHLRTSPSDVDARLVHGLILSWERRFDEARSALQQVLTQAPGYLDALLALMNTEWWSGNHVRARELARDVLSRDSGNTQARLVQQRLGITARPWFVSLTASRDTFTDTFEPWTEMSASLGRQTPVGSLILRGNRAERFGLTDDLIEVDFYPVLRAGTNGFVSIGISPDHTVYPKRRLAVDLYQSLGAGVEVSGGYRQLDFNSTTRIYVGTLSKYAGPWLVTSRVFHVPNRDEGGSWSYHAHVRRYGGAEGTNFVGLGYSYGINREEPRGAADLMQVDAHTGRVQFQFDVSRFQVFGGGVVSRQERVVLDPQWQTTLTAGFTIRF